MDQDLKDTLDLKEEIERHGWEAFVVAGSEIRGDERPDIVALKNGHSLLFKIVRLGSGSSKKDVSDRSEMMATRVANAGDGMGSANGYFAIQKGRIDEWFVMEYTAERLYYEYENRSLSHVLNRI